MKKIIYSLAIVFILHLSLNIENCEAQWLQSSGTSGQRIKKIVNVNNTLFAGVTSSNPLTGRLLKSTNDGVSWDSVNLGYQLSGVMDMASSGNIVCIGTYERGIVFTTNGGQTWIQNWVNGVNGNGVFNVGISGGNIFVRNNTAPPGTSYVYYISTNSGTTWNPAPQNSNAYFAPGTFLNVDSMFLNGAHQGLAKSTNHGFNWSMTQNNGLPSNPDGSKPLTALIFRNGTIYGGSITGIASSTDFGDNWTNRNMSFPMYTAFSDFLNRNDTIYASYNTLNSTTNYGVWRTTNFGQNWNSLNAGLPVSLSVYCMKDYDNKLFLGTNGNGIWYKSFSQLTGAVAENTVTPEEFILNQNFPNPFNPTTNIQFSINGYPLGQVQYVTLKVFDILGCEVRTLVNESLKSGTYEVSFDGSQIPSGIYFYKLTAGKFTQTRNMILIK